MEQNDTDESFETDLDDEQEGKQKECLILLIFSVEVCWSRVEQYTELQSMLMPLSPCFPPVARWLGFSTFTKTCFFVVRVAMFDIAQTERSFL